MALIRNRLRTAAGIAALIALAISGITACSSSGTDEVVVSSELAPSPPLAPPPEQAAVPAVEPPVAPTRAPAAPEPFEESGLTWAEVDLSGVFDPDQSSFLSLDSVGDGRVTVRTEGSDGGSRLLVSENGLDWTEIPIPDGFSPWGVDIAGDRWVIEGWDMYSDEPGIQVLFSDDQGASWSELVIDLGPLDGTAWIGNAFVAGERIVVVALSNSVPLVLEEGAPEDMYYEPSSSRVHVFLSDGGPAELVAEYPGWHTIGYGASDGFHLIVSGPDGHGLLTSPDGRQWSRTTADFEITGSGPDTIWTADQTGGEYRVERFDGVYGPGQVLTQPDEIGWIVDLAVGPAGIAAVGGPEAPYIGSEDEVGLPDVSIKKDGYELRYNQPEGGITLWDLEEDSAVYVFDAGVVESETPPEGVRAVEEDDGTVLVVFEDPETGAHLVAFSFLELAAATNAATDNAYETDTAFDPREFLVGWSADGTDWEWQDPEEVFGVSAFDEDENSFTEIQVAVGRDFVIAKVYTYEFPTAVFDEDAEIGFSDDAPAPTPDYYTTLSSSTSPSRWFIARVG